MTNIVRGLLGAVFLTASTTGAVAEEIALKIGDIAGESLIFFPQAGQSDWSGSPGWESVSIVAKPKDPEVWEFYKTLSIGFSMMNGEVGNAEARLMIAEDEGVKYLFAEEEHDGGIKMEITSFAVEGDTLALSGTLEMLMGPSENFGRDVDMSDPVEVTGEFDVTIARLE